MTKEQAQKIVDAMRRCVDSMMRGRVEIPGASLYDSGYKITKEDYETLKPFLYAQVDTNITVGEYELKTDERIATHYIIVGDEHYFDIPDEQNVTIAKVMNHAYFMLQNGRYKRIKLSDLYVEDAG